MAGAEIHIRIEGSDFRRKFDALKAKLGNLKPVMQDIGEEMLSRTQDRFHEERDAQGKRWQPLAPATLRRRSKKYGNAQATILRMRGHLYGSLNYRAEATRVAIGANRPYAAIHQFGGKAGRGHKVAIPARPYIGMGAEDTRAVENLLEEWLKE